jgi:hypothetical protein
MRRFVIPFVRVVAALVFTPLMPRPTNDGTPLNSGAGISPLDLTLAARSTSNPRLRALSLTSGGNPGRDTCAQPYPEATTRRLVDSG